MRTVHIKAEPKKKSFFGGGASAIMFGKGQQDKSRHAPLTSTGATSPSGRDSLVRKSEKSRNHTMGVMSLCNVNGMAPQVLFLRAGEGGELTRMH